MANQFGVPEITPAEVNEKREAGENFLLVDVREAHELQMANLGDGVIHMPLSDLAARRLEAIPESVSADKDAEIVVFCHHGARSAQVVAFLKGSGWTNVINMEGGIHYWASTVSPDVGTY
ncbi:MAG: rhodanese-like domain-containing protein [Chloroflexota bacterium]